MAATTTFRSLLTLRSTTFTLSRRLFTTTTPRVMPSSFTRPVRSPVRLNQTRCRVLRPGGAYSPLNSGSNYSERPPTEMPPLSPGSDYEHWLNQIRCRVNRSGGAYSPLNSGSNYSERPPTEMAPLFPGCDYEHWLIVMDTPGGEGATKQQMIDCYVKTLATVLGSEEEAKKKIYNVYCERYFAFGCEIDEETSNKLEGLPGVIFVLPDSYEDAEAELYVNGEIVQRSPVRQRRVRVPQRRVYHRVAHPRSNKNVTFLNVK